jgi:hypothetical protein
MAKEFDVKAIEALMGDVKARTQEREAAMEAELRHQKLNQKLFEMQQQLHESQLEMLRRVRVADLPFLLLPPRGQA